jgi:hypothetical protein
VLHQASANKRKERPSVPSAGTLPPTSTVGRGPPPSSSRRRYTGSAPPGRRRRVRGDGFRPYRRTLPPTSIAGRSRRR